jgi:hypothetical protein
MILNLETLDAKYDCFVPRWHLNAKYDIWWFCVSMTLECEILYIMSFVPWWSFNAKIIYDGFVPCCLWNEKYYIWWLCISMTLECEKIYLMVLNLETLHAKYDSFVPWWPLNAKWYMMALSLNDPWMQNMMYVGFVPRLPLNAKYDIWWFYASMTLECEI